ncbi:MAG TPA: hypothetical protein VJ989_03680, partial [Solirubrobacterales bacterium]|nr:hypothetical protein [Solirubrobacterales bacterium]
VSLLAAASAAAMLLPSAAGAVTVGAPLGLGANVGESCQGLVIFGTPPGCTIFGVDSGGAWTSQTPPGNWTITTARVRTGPAVGPMVFTVLRVLRSQAGSPPSGAICCTAPVESQVFTPAPNTVNEVPVNLPVTNTVEDIEGEPVEVIDYLGISMLDLSSSLPLHRATSSGDPAVSSGLSYFIPQIRGGQQALQAGGLTELVPLVNGEYQPAPATPTAPGAAPPTTAVPPPTTIDPPPPFGLLPGGRLLPGGARARLGVNAPGAGLLRAFSPLAGRARASSVHAPGESRARRRGKRKGKRRKPRLLIPARRRIKQAGKAYITVKLTKAGKHRLGKRGKLRLPLRFVFKSDDGGVTRRNRHLTFRR